MSAFCAGYIIAIILAVFVLVWLTYCMFCKEKHKSEAYQYSISDIRYKNQLLAQDQEIEEKKDKGLSAGIFILPSRHKHKDEEYEKRPDYPEIPAPIIQSGPEDLIKILNDSPRPGSDRDVTFEIDSNSQYHSDV